MHIRYQVQHSDDEIKCPPKQRAQVHSLSISGWLLSSSLHACSTLCSTAINRWLHAVWKHSMAFVCIVPAFLRHEQAVSDACTKMACLCLTNACRMHTTHCWSWVTASAQCHPWCKRWQTHVTAPQTRLPTAIRVIYQQWHAFWWYICSVQHAFEVYLQWAFGFSAKTIGNVFFRFTAWGSFA